jgi:hypothetical protein
MILSVYRAMSTLINFVYSLEPEQGELYFLSSEQVLLASVLSLK